ncbi:hypothetical protein [Archangium lansingense]|uniref:Uncharacterized protein n=1 Tax=Archangium lansingense TaxID=2995310 RepID=A0ABT4AP68_9BACT|nr:hypothetical protein [Archangium lansinium]MCY1083480.1 hypothetical protein [Archangium lansinium]
MGVLSRCGVVLLLASGPALAGPGSESRWGLRWNAGPGCIQAAPLARAVEERLGRTVFGPEPEYLVDGVLERGGPSGWKARLSLVDVRGNVLGSREVSTREEACSAIEPRLLLVMALMIDPTAALSGPASTSPAPASPPVQEPPPEPSPPESPRPRPEAPGPRMGGRANTLAATVSAGAGFGVVPGLAGTVWFVPGEWTWLVRMSLYPYESYTKDGGRLLLVSTGAETGVCPVSVGEGAWSVSGCATAGFSLVFAYSQGYEQGRMEPLLRGDLGLRARLERRLTHGTALQVGLGAGYGWLRPTVRLLKPDGTAEDLGLGLPVQGSVDVGVSFLGP